MKRTKHNLSNYRLMTHKLGQLLPSMNIDILPGDTISMRGSLLMRLSPPVRPVMHPINVREHTFFVPNRILLGDDWENFITGGPDGNDATILPTYTLQGPADVGTLIEYLGLPTHADAVGIEVDAMAIMAFNAVFNLYYRDQDLVLERDPMDITIPYIAWEKDIFTAARPTPQKGPDIALPITGNAPVKKVGDQVQFQAGIGGTNTNVQTDAAGNLTLFGSPNVPAGWPQDGTYYAELDDSLTASILDFRRAFGIQTYQENRSRWGSKYIDYLAALGINAGDARLQRPEYLGGSRQTISFSEVLNTSSDVAGSLEPLGKLGGHGISAMRGNRLVKFFSEHGTLITLLSTRPKSMYLDAVDKKWLRKTKEQYYQPELQFIGQEEILNNEIYADAANGDQIFGFNDRYSSYTYEPSKVVGEFRRTENAWHLGRSFDSPPALNGGFVTIDPTTMTRIFADQTGNDTLYTMAYHTVAGRRLVRANPKPRVM